MDIRSFFGKPLKTNEPKDISSVLEKGEFGNSFNGDRPQKKDSDKLPELNSLKKVVSSPHSMPSSQSDDVISGEKQEFAENKTKRKRLRKLAMDSEDENVVTENANALGEAEEKKRKLRNWINDELTPISGSSTNIQTDIQCWMDNNKKYVDPSTKLNASNDDGKQYIDINNYLSTLHPNVTNDAEVHTATSVKSNTPKRSYKENDGDAETSLFSASPTLSNKIPADETSATPPQSQKTVTSGPSPNNQSQIDESLEGVAGKKFVLTGELESMDRLMAIDKIRKLGGIVVSGVSGLTNYLVHGNKLEDGRDYTLGVKYKKANEFNKAGKASIKIIDEKAFLKLINYSPEVALEKVTPVIEELQVNEAKNPVSLPLTEKYRPTRLGELIGNRAAIEKMKEWLLSWEDVHKRGNKRPPQRVGYRVENVNSRCILLNGPPGIGKTTCVRLLAESCGYTCIEFNASDLRNKAAIDKISIMATGGQTLQLMKTAKVMNKTLLLLDEIDGMSSGDRGGIQAVISLIEITKSPIICICNDKSYQKMSTLMNKSYEIKFNNPSAGEFVARLKGVCNVEGIVITDEKLNELYQYSNGDLRFALNYIQFNHSQDLTFGFSNTKDDNYAVNPFECCERIFNNSKGTFLARYNDINELFFTDFNLMPLMIQENYTKYLSTVRYPLGLLSKLSLLFVYSDIIEQHIKKTQNYSLLPDLSAVTAILPSLEIKMHKGQLKDRLTFPQYLGNTSTKNKNLKLLNEIGMNMVNSTTSGINLVLDGYLDNIYNNVMNSLMNNDAEGAASMIESYGLSRELVIDGIASLRLKSQENLYVNVEAKVKSKLTRMLVGHVSRVGLLRNEDDVNKSIIRNPVSTGGKRRKTVKLNGRGLRHRRGALKNDSASKLDLSGKSKKKSSSYYLIVFIFLLLVLSGIFEVYNHVRVGKSLVGKMVDRRG